MNNFIEAKDANTTFKANRQKRDDELLSDSNVQYELERLNRKINKTAQEAYTHYIKFQFNEDVDIIAVEAVCRFLNDKGYTVNKNTVNIIEVVW